jgi:D-arabinose 1-dehydrogenase-like Zn-dependent alcohol dehydrogenase
MTTMRVMQVPKAHAAFELVERPIPEPGPNQVRIRVEACGICHSDLLAKEGFWPGLTYPRVPGHEVAGRVDKAGPGVTVWKPGQRVGVGWHGGHDFTCEACRIADFLNCEHGQITGLSFDGGYAEFMVAPQEALARVPDELSAPEAAPLMCAGITTFNALRNSGARPGDLVAVQGVGGLGHLAIQFASKMGFRTVAVSGGKDKEALARKLGASHYIDAGAADAGEELRKMGGAHLVFCTAPSGKAIAPLIAGLKQRGKLLIVAAATDAIPLASATLLSGRTIAGWPSGSSKDSEDAMNFSTLTGVRPMIETFPLERAAEAYEHMLSNKARFRVVLTVSGGA